MSGDPGAAGLRVDAGEKVSPQPVALDDPTPAHAGQGVHWRQVTTAASGRYMFTGADPDCRRERPLLDPPIDRRPGHADLLA